ncbi:UNVERIFIED_CONTAM: hypothetical protein Scaly_1934300 [Sesamum calycinum]|uniref:Reverse transcriptase domain-containing protein n=1 Tax=Sesamum calycinum TaxID=2727403 RepID=A0AAW2NIA7_9LAMI
MRLANGDANTKFFHARTSPRKQYNTISSLNGSNGVWRDKEEHTQTILLQHFRSIFVSTRPLVEHIDEVVSSVLTLINPEMDSQLALPFTTMEVKQATFGLFRAKQGFVALKLDINKAYDRVQWSFLRHVLLRLGFENDFVNLIMLLVTSVSYSLTLNGTKFGGVLLLDSGSRKEGEVAGGHTISSSAPSISHLLFADDTVLFSRAMKGQIDKIRNIPEAYARASRPVTFYVALLFLDTGSGSFSTCPLSKAGNVGKLGLRNLVNQNAEFFMYRVKSLT